jgi:hypothetical protein
MIIEIACGILLAGFMAMLMATRIFWILLGVCLFCATFGMALLIGSAVLR